MRLTLLHWQRVQRTCPPKRYPVLTICYVVLALLQVIFFTSCKKSVLPQGMSGLNAVSLNGKLAPNSLAGSDFTIVVMPDIQYETSNKDSATVAMLSSDINWIKAHKIDSNIVYVAGLGDITDDGDARPDEWVNAKNAYYALDTAGIPYGLAVGNHDQYPNHGYPVTNTTSQYNTYFGTAHFTGKAYYGGHYTGGSGANDSHYDLFTAGGVDWIVIYIEYDSQNEDRTGMNNWAYNLLGTYASRKAIIVSHYIIENVGTSTPNDWGNVGGVNPTNSQGRGIYNALKTRPNVCLFLCGHTGTGSGAEGYREDTYNGHTIKTILADYQFIKYGGNGFIRLMHFSVDNDRIQVRTYSPYINAYRYGQFTKTLFREPTHTRSNDFEDDGKTNLAFFNAGTWNVSGLANVTQGASGDIAVPADYNGDGEADYVYWHPADGTWHNLPSGTTLTYGLSGDVPVPADYNGDGNADPAVFRQPVAPSTNCTYWRSGAGGMLAIGAAGDIPIPADYNGDGQVDEATFNPTTKLFTFHDHATGNQTSWTYGAFGDIPVIGDYDGIGMAETMVYRPSTGQWFNHHTGIVTVWGGAAGDIPAPGDYVGNGKTQMAYYRGGVLHIYIDATHSQTITLGSSGDKIINLPFPVRNYYFP